VHAKPEVDVRRSTQASEGGQTSSRTGAIFGSGTSERQANESATASVEVKIKALRKLKPRRELYNERRLSTRETKTEVRHKALES
jgi:hypothetical protein